MKLSAGQKSGLAEFCTNFAVAWLTAGVIAPYISRQNFSEIFQIMIMSITLAGSLLSLMLYLTKEVKK